MKKTLTFILLVLAVTTFANAQETGEFHDTGLMYDTKVNVEDLDLLDNDDRYYGVLPDPNNDVFWTYNDNYIHKVDYSDRENPEVVSTRSDNVQGYVNYDEYNERLYYATDQGLDDDIIRYVDARDLTNVIYEHETEDRGNNIGLQPIPEENKMIREEQGDDYLIIYEYGNHSNVKDPYFDEHPLDGQNSKYLREQNKFVWQTDDWEVWVAPGDDLYNQTQIDGLSYSSWSFGFVNNRMITWNSADDTHEEIDITVDPYEFVEVHDAPQIDNFFDGHLVQGPGVVPKQRYAIGRYDNDIYVSDIENQEGTTISDVDLLGGRANYVKSDGQNVVTLAYDDEPDSIDLHYYSFPAVEPAMEILSAEPEGDVEADTTEEAEVQFNVDIQFNEASEGWINWFAYEEGEEPVEIETTEFDVEEGEQTFTATGEGFEINDTYEWHADVYIHEGDTVESTDVKQFTPRFEPSVFRALIEDVINDLQELPDAIQPHTGTIGLYGVGLLIVLSLTALAHSVGGWAFALFGAAGGIVLSALWGWFPFQTVFILALAVIIWVMFR